MTLVIIAALLISLALSRKKPKIAAVLNLAAAALLLVSRVIPGKADAFDWIFMVILLAAGVALLIVHKKEKD